MSADPIWVVAPKLSDGGVPWQSADPVWVVALAQLECLQATGHLIAHKPIVHNPNRVGGNPQDTPPPLTCTPLMLALDLLPLSSAMLVHQAETFSF
ncbi:hypothetical protein CYMTET_16622 [Cymbomonas tetramitiformis]|uniref:Uncharacterized protein n=1 Tax=Cymbomonas tetramitiformis TaxID=36881 RepID=A0AAE0L833_9CHLO|nr:hypothetical protein CYMTET_16622 [Cymbomonas tetramitiformis]